VNISLSVWRRWIMYTTGLTKPAHKMCGWVMTTTFVRNIFLSNTFYELHVSCARDTHRNVRNLHVTCPLLLSQFNQNRNVTTNSSNAPQYQISWRSVQRTWSCLLYANRQTEAEVRTFATISRQRAQNCYSENKWQHVKDSRMKQEDIETAMI
jgi:hypothetical protein